MRRLGCPGDENVASGMIGMAWPEWRQCHSRHSAAPSGWGRRGRGRRISSIAGSFLWPRRGYRADIQLMHGADLRPVIGDTPRVLGCRMEVSRGAQQEGRLAKRPVICPSRGWSAANRSSSVTASHMLRSTSQIQSGAGSACSKRYWASHCLGAVPCASRRSVAHLRADDRWRACSSNPRRFMRDSM
jgi:hypothetical protein